MTRTGLLMAAVCVSWLPARLALAEEPARVDVFVAGQDGYHTYRIPSLLVSAKGTLLAFCEGRKTSRSDHGDLDLVLRRSTDRGVTWEPMQVVYEEGGNEQITIGNPCPVVDQSTGRIWLPFCRDNDDVLITYSDDDGVSWAAPREITDSVKGDDWTWYATGPGVGIQIQQGPHKGRLVIPCDHREPVDGKLLKHSHVFYSDDHGATWQLGDSVSPHTDECQVIELAEKGHLLINMRNYWGREGGDASRDKQRAIAVSHDGGATWGPLEFDGTLIEPVCQASFLRYDWPTLARRGHVLFSNPASTSERHRLTVRVSLDDGRSWSASRELHPGPSAYSCLAVLPDGEIGCLYEGGTNHAYERIILARFGREWVTQE